MRFSTLACFVVLAVATVPGFFACSNVGTEETQTKGTVSLPLTAVSSSGKTYQLTGATFAVTGGTLTNPLSLSSASNPTVTTLSTELATGAYSIALASGWQMMRVESNGTTTAVEATLVSALTQAVSITDATVTPVTYRFSVDGTTVETGEGTLQVNVAVDEVTGTGGSGGEGGSSATGGSGSTGGASPTALAEWNFATSVDSWTANGAGAAISYASNATATDQGVIRITQGTATSTGVLLARWGSELDLTGATALHARVMLAVGTVSACTVHVQPGIQVNDGNYSGQWGWATVSDSWATEWVTVDMDITNAAVLAGLSKTASVSLLFTEATCTTPIELLVDRVWVD